MGLPQRPSTWAEIVISKPSLRPRRKLSTIEQASAVGRIATGAPVNGIVEVGGPEKFRLDELGRHYLAANKDSREVVADPKARYYGVDLSERTLLPGNDAQLGKTRFETWLTQSSAKAAGTR